MFSILKPGSMLGNVFRINVLRFARGTDIFSLILPRFSVSIVEISCPAKGVINMKNPIKIARIDANVIVAAMFLGILIPFILIRDGRNEDIDNQIAEEPC